MKKFKVVAVYTSYCVCEIDAIDEDQAHELARELDGSDFEPLENEGDWRIYEVLEVEQ